MRKRIITGFIASTVLLTACGKKTVENKQDSRSFFAMDTYMTVTAAAIIISNTTGI